MYLFTVTNSRTKEYYITLSIKDIGDTIWSRSLDPAKLFTEFNDGYILEDNRKVPGTFLRVVKSVKTEDYLFQLLFNYIEKHINNQKFLGVYFNI